MEETLNKLLPLLALLVGWFLKELSESFARHTRHKAAAGRALAELLEARHRLIGVEHLVGVFHREYPMPGAAVPYVRTAIEQLMGGQIDIVKNYEDAIRLIAENDPVTAFRFRAGTQAQSMLQGWREFALKATEHVQPEDIENAEKKIKEMILPNLDELSLSLAKYHSWHSYYRVKNIIKNGSDISEDIKRMMAEVMKQPQGKPN